MTTEDITGWSGPVTIKTCEQGNLYGKIKIYTTI